MAELSYRDAVAYGIAQEMRRDPALVILGEDVAAAGGVFKTTVGLLDELIAPLGIRPAKQGGEHVFAVRAVAIGDASTKRANNPTTQSRDGRRASTVENDSRIDFTHLLLGRFHTVTLWRVGSYLSAPVHQEERATHAPVQ